MKTIVIVLGFIVNDHGAVHKVAYETQFENCYQAEQAALERAWVDYVETGKADEVSIESCDGKEQPEMPISSALR